jgi:hypothetical protein
MRYHKRSLFEDRRDIKELAMNRILPIEISDDHRSRWIVLELTCNHSWDNVM